MQFDPSLQLKIIGYGAGNVFTPGPNHTIWSYLSRKSDAAAIMDKIKAVAPVATLVVKDDAIPRGVMVVSNDDSVGLWNIAGTMPDPASTDARPLDPLIVNESVSQLGERETNPVPPEDDLTKFAQKKPLTLTYSNFYGYAQFAWR